MTDDTPDTLALLPAGLRDLLPPEAETEAMAVEALMAVFASHGYQRVAPPLLEFEDSLLAGSGAAVAEQAFRLLDPDSHRMMALRADTTPQVARIAATRLAAAPRPLRLSYAGACLRVRGSQLSPDRQVPQAGIELIGCDSPAADAEIVLAGAEALATVGVTRISIDLTVPPLAPALLDAAGIAGAQRQALARALDRKDEAAVAMHGGDLAGQLNALLRAAGPADAALASIAGIALPAAAQDQLGRLVATAREIRARAPSLRLTIDPLEFRGFRYHTGVSVTVYAPGRREELGRGGRYICGDGEAATGLTLYPHAILRAAQPSAGRARVFVPHGEAAASAGAADLRRQGFATVAGLEPAVNASAEARRLGCSHLLRDGALTPVD